MSARAYDGICERVRHLAKAYGVVLIVFGGDKGNGLSVSMPDEEMQRMLPKFLREVADLIEEEMEMGEQVKMPI
jgi:hypothetical protein